MSKTTIIFHLVATSVRAQSKSEVKNINQVSHVSPEAPGLESFSTEFSGHDQGAGAKVEQAAIKPAPTWNAHHVSRGLTCSPIVGSLRNYILRRMHFICKIKGFYSNYITLQTKI